MLRSLLPLGIATFAAAQLGPMVPPKCSSNSKFGSVLNFTDSDSNARCLSLVTPPTSDPLPVLFYFHGQGGNAQNCGESPGEDDGKSLVDLALEYGFALVCGEALQFDPQGGEWMLPEVVTDQTGNRCEESDSVDRSYISVALDELAALGLDTSRVFFSGCSMGSVFSEYTSTCTALAEKEKTVKSLTAFATHSAGLKVKGDGLSWPPLPNNTSVLTGECDDCQWFPIKPVAMDGVKICVFDNEQDPNADAPDFYTSSVNLVRAMEALGNAVESTFLPGFHCEIHSYDAIVQCLDDSSGRLISA